MLCKDCPLPLLSIQCCTRLRCPSVVLKAAAHDKTALPLFPATPSRRCRGDKGAMCQWYAHCAHHRSKGRGIDVDHVLASMPDSGRATKLGRVLGQQISEWDLHNRRYRWACRSAGSMVLHLALQRTESCSIESVSSKRCASSRGGG